MMKRTRKTRRSATRRRPVAAPPGNDVKWLTADEAANYLSIPAESVRELARRKILPGHKLRGVGNSGKLWRFHSHALDEYVRGAEVTLPTSV